MADVAWMIRRLKAMSFPEIMWRLSQKNIQNKEKKRFYSSRQAIGDSLFNSRLSGLNIDGGKLFLNLDNREYSVNTVLPLLGGYNYEKYKSAWNAGFQTENTWPDEFSYTLEYKQQDAIGDARTNWELNRHYQFAILAKNYAASNNRKYLQEFQQLFNDWNQKNPFLWGISWTSVMEAAIRCSNWCYAFGFLSSSEAVPAKLLEKLRTGILNMTDYIANHYSRYSSANNHLIVEAYAIGQSGILFDNRDWIKLSVDILTRELPLQNYADGVNRELSLHYQSFYMEAMGLMMRLLIKNQRSVPESWYIWLDKMCCYLADCMGDYGEVVEFGDNDEGKILDLCGGLNHYRYVLELFSILLNRQYCDLSIGVCENIKWLFGEKEIEASTRKSVYAPPNSICYKEGGNTILRSRDRRILIGIDHAALGFGSIAAHGHADALSFQMYVEGIPVFIDPGTYIYHCSLVDRNIYRRTENHNTLCIDRKDQSEMLGAFLWGKRAECILLDYSDGEEVFLKASHDGYQNACVRTFQFDGIKRLQITDQTVDKGHKISTFIFRPETQIDIDNNVVNFKVSRVKGSIQFVCNMDINLSLSKKMYSEFYGIQEQTISLDVEFNGEKLTTTIQID